jgi:hypothetical protein
VWRELPATGLGGEPVIKSLPKTTLLSPGKKGWGDSAERS